MVHDVIVIGGGASGMFCAITASDYGKRVVLLEAGKRVGRKILTTGNGRCNISNYCIKPPYHHFHSQNDQFFKSALDHLSVEATVDLFYQLGLPIIELEKGKLYPQSLQASSVVDVLRMCCEERGIETILEEKVKEIKKDSQTFLIKTENNLYKAHHVVVACGGLAAPETGSDGSILSVLQGLGHRVIQQYPSIVQLKLDYPHLKAISGVKFDGRASIRVDQDIIKSDDGEILFTDYGISGPPILQISRYASINLAEKRSVQVIVDFYPEKTSQEVIDFFETHFGIFSYRTVVDSLNGVINKKLIPTLLKEAGIDNIHKTCDQLTYKEKANFYNILKAWAFKCVDTNGFRFSQTTIGGIDTMDVHPHTMESKLVPNLYLCGEVLDVDGDCGGFNLQWAWSSGYLAGQSVGLK